MENDADFTGSTCADLCKAKAEEKAQGTEIGVGTYKDKSGVKTTSTPPKTMSTFCLSGP